MKTVQYEAVTINCSGKDHLAYFCYLWDDESQVWVWDEDKLSYNEALEKYPQTEYNWQQIVKD